MANIISESWVIVSSLLCIQAPLSALILGMIFFQYWSYSRVKNWATTTGTIITSEIVYKKFGGRGSKIAHPIIHYLYHVQGKQYQGETIAPGPVIAGTGSERLIQKFPAGSTVEVYYNPQDPSQAVIERIASNRSALWVALILMNLFLCVGSFFVQMFI
jgi:hypothetical protein